MSNVLYINKPVGITSFDVCYKLRHVLNTKKIGHTGTLDPNASGVMIILYDSSTKANQFLVSDRKEYIAEVSVGFETDTLDTDGNIINRQKIIMPSKEEIISTLNSFLGPSKQTVPITSSKKVNGLKLYEYQRKDKEVTLPIIDINVYDIELLSISDTKFSYRCLVSSGTYVRALTRDILTKLNIIGTLSGLLRSKIDDIDINECDNLNDVVLGKYQIHDLFDVLSRRYKCYEYEKIEDVVNGKRIKIDSNEDMLLIINNGKLYAMYKKDGSEYKCCRGLL